MKNLLLIAGLLVSGLAQATVSGTPYAPEVDVRFDNLEANDKNNSSQALRVARATYDFAIHGGAISDIGLGVYLPANAVVTKGYLYFKTAVTGSGGRLGFYCEDANNIFGMQNVTSIAAGSVMATNQNSVLLPRFVASVQIASKCEIKASIDGAAITAGKVNLFLEYLITD